MAFVLWVSIRHLKIFINCEVQSYNWLIWLKETPWRSNTWWFSSFLWCFVIFLAGLTPILADLKDSRRLLMVLWKISCTSYSLWLMPKWLRLYLWWCCSEREEQIRQMRCKPYACVWMCVGEEQFIHSFCSCTGAAVEDDGHWCLPPHSSRLAHGCPGIQRE